MRIGTAIKKSVRFLSGNKRRMNLRQKYDLMNKVVKHSLKHNVSLHAAVEAHSHIWQKKHGYSASTVHKWLTPEAVDHFRRRHNALHKVVARALGRATARASLSTVRGGIRAGKAVYRKVSVNRLKTIPTIKAARIIRAPHPLHTIKPSFKPSGGIRHIR